MHFITSEDLPHITHVC